MSHQVLIYPTKTRSDLVGHMSSLKKKTIGCPLLSCSSWISSTLERHWHDIWFRRRTVCRAQVSYRFDTSSTDSVELKAFGRFCHTTPKKTAAPIWFRHRSSYLIRQLGSAHEWSGVWTRPESVLIRHEKTSRPSQARNCWNQSQVGVNPRPVARVLLYHFSSIWLFP